ncbi:two component response regulator receiver protein [Leptospira ryugenii]|uniref:Two component response regulator receiver protein n=1 Tax=Leptospira ryugenii TaxID=1917863 RepID=A0A2P2E305_9LEPT|nr:response regulator [Leptospira ryugenii]GBF51285.1 two component response regulator receiver protein [Leptospira ryugenii]
MRVLIVDDNDKYANNLKLFFDTKGIQSVRARDAREGWTVFQSDPNFDVVISDVTMETQTSGLWMMRKIYKSKFPGVMIIASTGFDVAGVMFFSKFILPFFCGLHWMIPKVPLKKGEVQLFPTTLANNLTKPF